MNISKLVSIAAASLLLVACGGGGGGGGGGTAGPAPVPPPTSQPAPTPPAATPDKVEGELSVEIKPIGPGDLATNGFVINESGGAQLVGSSEALKALKAGDMVQLPPDPDSGREIAFLGKVESLASEGTSVRVQVAAAHIEDAFKQLSWQIDTARTGAQVAGVVGSNGQVLKNFRFMPTQVGALSVGVNGLTGEISFDRTFKVGGEDVTLSANVKLDNVSLQTRGEFDPAKYAGGGGWGRIGATIRGNVSGTVKVAALDLKGGLGDALFEAESWNLLKWRGNRFFNMEGLGNADKKGRIPLGGLVVIPGGAIGFVGARFQNTAVLQTLARSTAGIIWIYMDVNGALSMQGEAGVSVDNYRFVYGEDYVLRGAAFDFTGTREFAPLDAHLFATGKFEVEQREGLTVAADLLIAGIRPLNLNAFAGLKYSGKFRGENMRLQLSPKLGATGTWGCFENKFWVGIEGELALRVKAELKPGTTGKLLTGLFGKNPGVFVGMKWSGELATFYKDEIVKGLHAVCQGELTSPILEVDVAQNKRVEILDPRTGKPLTDVLGNRLELPTRLKWTVRNPALARVSGDIGGALINGQETGSTLLGVVDELSGWSADSVLVVGGLCSRSPLVGGSEGGRTWNEVFMTCKEKQTGAEIVSYHSLYNVGPGNDYQWQFQENRQGSGRNSSAHAYFDEGVTGTFKSSRVRKSNFLQTGDQPPSFADDAEYHAYANLWEARRTLYRTDPVADRIIESESVECRTGAPTRSQKMVNGQDAGTAISFGCPTRASVEAMNDIKLNDNPLYKEFLKAFPRP